MAKKNILQALAELPLLVGEVEFLQTEVAAGVVTASPGISTSISGIPGKLSLVFTPNALASVTSGVSPA